MADDGYIKIKTKIEGLAASLKGITDLGMGVFGLKNILGVCASAVRQLNAVMKDLTDAYKAQRAAEVSLSTAIKNNPYLDSSSQKRLEEYASKLQKIAAVGDEKILPYMAQLASAGRTEAQIMDIMSAALDASAGGMISLDEAVRGLNVSFSGSTGRLAQQIPALKNLTEEELRQGKAIEVVKAAYKDQAANVASATKSSEKLKNAVGDLKEELGASVEYGLRPWNEKLAEMVSKTAAALNETRKLKEALDALNGGKANAADYDALLKENQFYIDEYKRSVRETNAAYSAGEMPLERYNLIMENLNQQYAQYLDNARKWTIERDKARRAEKDANAGMITAAEEAEARKKEAAAAAEAAKAEADRTQKRAEFIEENKADREKNLKAMEIEAQLRGEQIDDEELLGEYIRSYIDLLTGAPDLVKAEDAEAKELLATIEKQTAKVQERLAAEKLSAEEAARRAAEQAEAEAAINEFVKHLEGITAPDRRSLQERLADEKAQLDRFYREMLEMAILSEDQKEELERQYFEKRRVLIEVQKEAEMAAIEELKQARKDLAKESLDSLVSTVNTFSSIAKENSEARLDVRIAEIEAEELSEEEKNKKILDAQKKAAKEQYRIELWQWTVSSLQAAANIAEGISKCFAEQGPYGFITSALVAAAGAAQIATIIASKPQPPAFATGGVVPGNSYSGDRITALVNSGEMILTRQQQARLFDIATGAAAGETNINIKNYRANDTDVRASVNGHEIELIIDKRVKDSMAAGRYNKAYGIMQNNLAGARITN